MLQEGAEELPVDHAPDHRPEDHPVQDVDQLADDLGLEFEGEEVNDQGLVPLHVPGKPPPHQVEEEGVADVPHDHPEPEGEEDGDHGGGVKGPVLGGVQEAHQELKGLGPRGVVQDHGDPVRLVVLVHGLKGVDHALLVPGEGLLHLGLGLHGDVAQEGEAEAARGQLLQGLKPGHLVLGPGPEALEGGGALPGELGQVLAHLGKLPRGRLGPLLEPPRRLGEGSSPKAPGSLSSATPARERAALAWSTSLRWTTTRAATPPA